MTKFDQSANKTSKPDHNALNWTPLQDILSNHPNLRTAEATSEAVQLVLGERAIIGKVLLICGDRGIRTVVLDSLGISLPEQPNTTTVHGNVTVLWLSPSEWMFITPQGSEQDLTLSLQKALTSLHAMVVNVSDRWTVISLSGSEAISVLNKGTSIDIHSPAMRVGRCCQTQLFSIPVIILPKDESPAFEILVDYTFSEYLWRWFEYSADGLELQVLDTTAI